jgi:ribonuclease HI
MIRTATDPSAANRQVTVWIGGASRGNPGPSAAGVVLVHADGRVYRRCSRYLGRSTSNEAEYHALLIGLKRTLGDGFRRVVVRSSSELVVNQLAGHYSVKDPTLQRLHATARALLQHFDAWRAEHIPRSQNAEAHRLAHKAIDLQHQREALVAT